MKLPKKKYNIIYADPPWKYKENWGNGSNEHTYPSMDIEDIKNLPIQDLSEDNCHLYLWVTNPFLEEGLEVCKAWGFKYKTLITWIKTYKDGTPEMGMGYYFRGCTEHIIFAVKGKMKIKNKVTKNMFKAFNDRKLHSRKPDCVRKMIVNCSGDLPRLELFARQKTSGWDVWGNQVPDDEQQNLHNLDEM
jgi:site-specific DNA-methyltransferase (adenine-specific)